MHLLVTIVAAAIGLLILLVVLKFVLKLAWHLFTLGCAVILVLAVLAAVGSYFLR